ncbi:Allergen Fus c 3, partial [Fusarium mundagurra]
SVFDNILNQFEQDPVFIDPSYKTPGHHLSAMSPIPHIPLTQPPLDPSWTETYKAGKHPSCLTDVDGDDNLLKKSKQTPHIISSDEQLDPAWSDMDQTTVPPQPLTAALSAQLGREKNNKEGLKDVSNNPTEVKMRSASFRPKKVHKHQLPAHILEARKSHNNVEKQYRTRLKLRFERLLAVLEASKVRDEVAGEGDSELPDLGYSRGEVLDAASQRILTLEEENRHLSIQIRNLEQGFMSR